MLAMTNNRRIRKEATFPVFLERQLLEGVVFGTQVQVRGRSSKNKILLSGVQKQANRWLQLDSNLHGEAPLQGAPTTRTQTSSQGKLATLEPGQKKKNSHETKSRDHSQRSVCANTYDSAGETTTQTPAPRVQLPHIRL